MNAIAPKLPALIGGSADLDPSTHTALKGLGDFNPPPATGDDAQGSDGGGWSYAGRNLHFGVREHAMGAIVNGLAAHGGIIPYGATFLIFSDYMRPPIRLAALMGLHVVHVFTHDSIALGEDGPTHQPVEQLAEPARDPEPHRDPPRPTPTRPRWPGGRAGDARSPGAAGADAGRTCPRSIAAATRSADGLRRGAYVLSDAPRRQARADPDRQRLGGRPDRRGGGAAAAREGVAVRCVSMPSWELFDAQPQSYRDAVLPPSVRARLAVEAGVPQGWHRYVGDARRRARRRSLRRVGAGRRAAARIRLHRRQRLCARTDVAG